MDENFTASPTILNFSDTTSSGEEESTTLIPVMDTLHSDTSFPGWKLIIFVVACIICTLGICGNLLTIIAFVKNRRLREPTKYLLLHLAVIDFLSSLAAADLAFYQLVDDGVRIAMKSMAACLWPLWAANFSIYTSLGGIILVSLDRLFSVLMPLQHRRHKKTDNVRKAILVTWSIVLLTTSLPLFGWNNWRQGIPCATPFVYHKVYFYLIFLIVPIITLVLVAISNTAIAVVTARKMRDIAPATNTMQIHALEASARPPLPIEKGDHANNGPPNYRRGQRQHRTTQLLLLVVGAFICLWLPFVTMLVIIQSYVESMSPPPRYVLILYEVSKLLMVASFAVNPFIYCWRSKVFRQTYLQILTCKKVRRVSQW